jgi:hypothetical protein
MVEGNDVTLHENSIVVVFGQIGRGDQIMRQIGNIEYMAKNYWSTQLTMKYWLQLDISHPFRVDHISIGHSDSHSTGNTVEEPLQMMSHV